MNNPGKKVIIIGGGIAGLATAHYLRKQGIDSIVIEREKNVGGSVRTILKEEKYLLELGPNTFPASADPLLRLARELSIDTFVVESEKPSRSRYIFSRGRLCHIPSSLGAFLSNPVMFVKLTTKRGGKEILAAMEDESVLHGLTNAEREYGNAFREIKKLAGNMKKNGLLSFRWGMGTLSARLEEELRSRIETSAIAKSVERRRDGGLKVYLEEQYLPLETDAVIVATQAPAAAKLVLNLDPELSKSLTAVPYAPLAIVHTAFSETDIPRILDGSGILIPQGEGTRLLGSTWSSSLFKQRCPKNEVLLTNFLGGADDTTFLDLSDKEIVDETLSALQKILEITAKPRFVYVKRWGHSIPQHTPDHKNRIELIRERLNSLRGVFMTGSYFAGVSVSDTIAHARNEVDQVVGYLHHR